ncbi:alpha/beta fold hydrolase [Marinibaculum pumilum]|uniref:Alpha/beta fold hydrolase n=1 Tax=Marinibaculum pumilum TaxID=1766165 RepID=A0ABV7L9N6_9PROT
MAVCVLVHGAWHGGWCWEKLQPLLEQAGHRTVAPDLPGSGRDPTPAAEVTLDRYVEAVVAVIEAQQQPVVLVGHSLAGLTITPVAEAVPDRLRALVYLTAQLLPEGQSLLDWRAGKPPTLISQNRVMSDDGLTSTIRPEALVEIFYGGCDPADAEAAVARLRPQAMAPSTVPMRCSAERYGRVPRYYIECLQDKAIPIDDQRDMQAATPCRRVFTLDSDHSPFLSMPQRLAACIDEIARAEGGA